ncbi:MAG: hypothetical protein LUH40_02600, partial [Clostridiales bacterium]|nr:hypothetical protein [Clostridiales bacterium]
LQFILTQHTFKGNLTPSLGLQTSRFNFKFRTDEGSAKMTGGTHLLSGRLLSTASGTAGFLFLPMPLQR